MNRSIMYVEVPQDVRDRLNRQLKAVPERIPEVLRKAINSAAQFAKKDTPERIKKEYTLKRASERVRQSIAAYEPARGKHYQATIRFEGRPEPLYDFHVRKNGVRVSAKANALRSSSLKDLTVVDGGKTLKAFVQKIETDKGTHHVGVFRRLTRKEAKEQQKYFDELAKNGGKKKETKRNAIKQLYSTSIPQMVKNDGVYPKIEADIKEKLRENLDKHIAAVMRGMT